MHPQRFLVEISGKQLRLFLHTCRSLVALWLSTCKHLFSDVLLRYSRSRIVLMSSAWPSDTVGKPRGSTQQVFVPVGQRSQSSDLQLTWAGHVNQYLSHQQMR
jgi:hypothetical protein